MDRDHLGKAHPGWADVSVRSAGNTGIVRTSAQNEDGVAFRKREIGRKEKRSHV